MAGCTRPGTLGTPRPGPARRLALSLLLLAGLAAVLAGCTRRFYRNNTDKEVSEVLKDKDCYPPWRLEQYHVYPDPRARFADPTNPDRPPMPPDDPAARCLAPNPQRPGKAGVAKVEGMAYLELLAAWDAENRARLAAEEPQRGGQAPAAGYGDQGGGTPNPDGSAAGRDAEARPFLITLEQAVELALINSREYQDRREDLYLTALPVTLERFAFAPQFFALGTAVREATGRSTPEGQHNRWRFTGSTGLSKVFSTGALLLFRFANQTVVELANTRGRPTISTSTLSLDIVQPLLRGAGRAVTLEPLTQVERNLLYEVRDFARFRKQFYVVITSGADFSRQFLSPGFGFRSGRLEALSGVTGLSGANVFPGTGGRSAVGISSNAPTEGYLPNLLLKAFLNNERANVASFEDILRRFEGLKEGPDVTQLQVGQVEQQLLQGRSTVLQRQQDYRDSLDRLKLQLGLPTDLPIEVDEGPVRLIARHIQGYDELRTLSRAALDEATVYEPLELSLNLLAHQLTFNPLFPSGPAVAFQAGFRPNVDLPGPLAGLLRARLRRIAESSPLVQGTNFQKEFPKRWDAVRALPDKELEDRARALDQTRRDVEAAQRELRDQGRPIPPELPARLAATEAGLALVQLEQALRAYEKRVWMETTGAERLRRYQIVLRSALSSFDIVLAEPRKERLDKLRETWPDLPPLLVGEVDLLTAEYEEAQTLVGQAALTNRFDLMNQRARLVDAWRQITVAANALLGTVNVEYHANSFTPPGQARPLNIGGSGNRHQLVIDTELPLVRKLERNNYRVAQIAYQRERRALMAAEDEVLANVRQELRQLRQLAQNYKIQQQAVELAYFVVENSLEVFYAPPVPGQGSSAGTQAALTTQLLNAQNSLPRAQNQLFSVWVNFQIARLQLYRDLELLQLDPRGVWIDDLANRPLPPASAPPGPPANPAAGAAPPQPRPVEAAAAR